MTLRTWFTLVAVLALVAAACAGSDAEAETTTTVTAAEATTSTTAAAEEPTTTTTTAPPAETTTTASGEGSSATLASLRESMARTGAATKGRMEGTISITGISDLPTDSFVMPFSGAFDNEAGNFSFIIDMSFLAAQGFDAASLLLLQLAGGQQTREEVAGGLLATRAYPGVSGITSVRHDGNAAKRPYLLGVNRGRIVSIDETGEPPYLHIPEQKTLGDLDTDEVE